MQLFCLRSTRSPARWVGIQCVAELQAFNFSSYLVTMKLSEIKTVGILGAGTLGLRIGLRAAIDGYQVCIYDIKETQLEAAKKVQDKILRRSVKKGILKPSEIEGVWDRLSFTTEKKVVANNVDLVSESVIEDLDTKLAVYESFADLWPVQTLLTTNTSYLLPSQIAEASGRPDKFCAFHFHDVFNANVVDIMPHATTADWIPELLHQFGKSIHQIPVFVAKETPGYIFNNMLMSLLGAAGNLVTKELATPADVDRSWMGNMNTNIGPFGMIDQIGLETAWRVTKVRTDSRSQRFAALLKSYIEEGKMGQKSGEGFYKYPGPAYTEQGFLD